MPTFVVFILSISKIISNCVVHASQLALYTSDGRTAEVAWLNMDWMEWGAMFMRAMFTMPQCKTSKAKLIAFMSSMDRHTCWFLALGDLLATTKMDVYEPGNGWLIPQLQEVQHPGKKVNQIIKALLPVE